MKVELNHYATQFLTGNGNFRGYLNRFGIAGDESCRWCNVRDTQKYVLYDCWKYVEIRLGLIRELGQLVYGLI